MVAEIYRPEVRQTRARSGTIVFVPGIEGSIILDPRDGRRYWGAWGHGAPQVARDPDALRKFSLPMKLGAPLGSLIDDLQAGPPLLDVQLGLVANTIHVRGYKGIFEGLLSHLMEPEAKLSRDLALPLETIRRGQFPIVEHGYDWRREISLEAASLHRTVLEAIQRSKDADHRVDLVAHSMGSLLVRWYLRYGDAALPEDGSLPPVTWAGARYVRRAIIVAPPNAGSVSMVEGLRDGVQPSPLLPRYPAALLGTFPSVYELLPHAGESVVDAETGKPVDVYDVRNWERWGWGLLDPKQAHVLAMLLPDVSNARARHEIARDHVAKLLRRAKQFHAALDAPIAPPRSLRIHLFIGDNVPTPAALTVDRSGQATCVRFEPGDGRVTRRSALRDLRSSETPGRLASAVDWHSVHFADADHMGIVASPSFLDDALYLLLDAPDPTLDATTH